MNPFAVNNRQSNILHYQLVSFYFIDYQFPYITNIVSENIHVIHENKIICLWCYCYCYLQHTFTLNFEVCIGWKRSL